MKTLRFTLLLIFAMICFHAQSDIIITNPGSGKLLFSVQNPDDFPEYVIIGLINKPGISGFTPVPVIVKKGTYYEAPGKITFVAIKKSYLAGKKLEDIDWQNKNIYRADENAPNLTSNRYRVPAVGTIKVDHRITGFTDSTMIICISQVTYNFQDKSKPDSISHFEYELPKTTK